MNFKEIICSAIKFDGIDKQTIISNLTLTPDASMGDYSLPCFVFSRQRVFHSEFYLLSLSLLASLCSFSKENIYSIREHISLMLQCDEQTR